MVLLCFDGSDDAAAAIAKAGELLTPGNAVVLTVWQLVAVWEPYDPATILTAPLSRLAPSAMSLDEIAADWRGKRWSDVVLAGDAGSGRRAVWLRVRRRG